MKRPAPSLHRVPTPGPCAAPRTRTLIVGITGDGYVPVIEDSISDRADILLGLGRSVIDLPSVLLDTEPAFEEPRRQAAEQLRREFGYEAGELIPMEVSAPPGALLAPMLKIAGWRVRIGFVPGVYEVPLWRVPEWLWQRRAAGAIEAPGLRRALALAQECFPRWARARLCRAIGELEAHAPVSGPQPRPRGAAVRHRGSSA